MNHLYRLKIIVRKHNPERAGAIQQAIKKGWKWENWKELKICEEGNSLPTIQTIVELGTTEIGKDGSGDLVRWVIKEIMRDIWEANQSYCGVSIYSTCLEEHFFEEYCGSEEAYEAAKIIKQSNSKRKKRDIRSYYDCKTAQ